MTGAMITSLIKEAVTTPQTAVARAIGWQLDRQTLVMMLILITLLPSMLSSALLFLLPMPNANIEAFIQSLIAYQAPIFYALLQIFKTMLAAFALFYVGRLFGGTGRAEDILTAFALIQATGIVLFLLVAFIGVLFQTIAYLGLLAFIVWFIRATIIAVNVAHQMNDNMKAFFVVLLAGVVTITVYILGISMVMGEAPHIKEI